MGLLDGLRKALTELPLSEITGERLALARDLLAQAESRLEQSEAKVAIFEAENRNLQRQLEHAKKENQLLLQQYQTQQEASKQRRVEFTELHGVLWQREANGKWFPYPWCPDCRRPMFSMDDIFPFECKRCKTVTPFVKGDLRAFMPQA